jgi:hypothetical protein
MTLAIAHREGDRAILDALRETKPPFSPDAVVKEFCDLLKSYGLRSVQGDRYGGTWPASRFQAHGIHYIVAEKTKSEIYLDTLPLLNSHRIELLEHPRLTAQLLNLERRTRSGGKDLVDHAPNAHDDLINSAAGALLLAAGTPAIDGVPVLVGKHGYWSRAFDGSNRDADYPVYGDEYGDLDDDDDGSSETVKIGF